MSNYNASNEIENQYQNNFSDKQSNNDLINFQNQYKMGNVGQKWKMTILNGNNI